MSSSIRFIRIEVSGTTVIYSLMFHYVNHSLVIPLTSDYSHVDHIILVFVSMDCYFLDKSFLRILLRSSHI
jgi:hypothetical protein